VSLFRSLISESYPFVSSVLRLYCRALCRLQEEGEERERERGRNEQLDALPQWQAIIAVCVDWVSLAEDESDRHSFQISTSFLRFFYPASPVSRIDSVCASVCDLVTRGTSSQQLSLHGNTFGEQVAVLSLWRCGAEVKGQNMESLSPEMFRVNTLVASTSTLLK